MRTGAEGRVRAENFQNYTGKPVSPSCRSPLLVNRVSRGTSNTVVAVVVVVAAVFFSLIFRLCSDIGAKNSQSKHFVLIYVSLSATDRPVQVYFGRCYERDVYTVSGRPSRGMPHACISRVLVARFPIFMPVFFQ